MKVLVIGGHGSIGSRYCAILRYLSVPYTVWDFDTRREQLDGPDKLRNCCGRSFDRAIIAAPTKYHAAYCHALYDLEVDFLCEKPMSHSMEQCEALTYRQSRVNTKGHIVNNYRFLFKKYKPKKYIKYDFYKTGPDGIWWDCCQLVYIADALGIDLEISNVSPVWTLETGKKKIPYKEVEKSYVYMLASWLSGDTEGLWTMQDGLHMTAAVRKRIRESTDRCASKKHKRPVEA